MKNIKNDKKIGILDWLIFLAIIIMFIMVYIPQSIWVEEDYYKKQRRQRMTVISQAAEFYYELTGEHTTDHIELFSLVEASMDSLIADSTFIGNKNILINNKSYNVRLEPGFHTIIDTTFSESEKVKVEISDTLYTIIMTDEEDGSLDTLIANTKNINKYKNDSLFVDILKETTENRFETKSNYLRRKYHLNEELIYCPISNDNKNKKFLLSLIESSDGNSKSFKISSPVSKSDAERRYVIFNYNPGKEESIVGGKKSWAEN
tara:strand:- start:207 stop:992 length:786 start_codon:yes stop_codon:yes gene_type:complete